MKKFTTKVATLLGACLVASSSMAQSQMVKMETSMPEGSKMTLLVNASHRGLSVDWGDGNPIQYVENAKEPIMKIEGIVKGKTITITGNKKWTMLDCSNCSLEQLYLGESNLRNISCSHNNLKELVLKKRNRLIDLDCSYNQISNLVFSSDDHNKAGEDLPSLKNLNISHNLFSGAFSWLFPSLDNLNISDNKFENFYPAGNNVKFINCANNSLEGILNLQKYPYLETLICNDNKFFALSFHNKGEHIKQLVCDNNELGLISLAEADSVQDISCQNNLLNKVTLASDIPLITYNASGNALDFSSLPGKTETLQYFGFDSQKPFDVSRLKGVLKKDGVSYIPLSENWDDRKLVDFGTKVTLADGSTDVSAKWYTVMSDGSAKEMTQRTSSSGIEDYYASSNKFAFFTPQKQAYVTFTSNAYGCTIQSRPIMIGDNVTGIVSVPAGQDCLQVQVGRGVLMVKGNGDLNVYSTDGKCMWQGVVNGAETITLPQGVYVVNNKKVIL